MTNLFKTPKASLTTEPFIPCFTELIHDSANDYRLYHTACVMKNGKLFRARATSTNLQWSITTVVTPNWRSIAIANLANYGQVFACCPKADGGVRLIVTKKEGGNFRLAVIDFSVVSGNPDQYEIVHNGGQPINGLTDTAQIGIVSENEIWVHYGSSLVEPRGNIWQTDILGSSFTRYTMGANPTIWNTVYNFPFLTHASAGQVTSEPGGNSDLVNLQWGYIPHGGLSVNEIDSDTVVISVGMTFWRKFGFDTHRQGLMTFIYHRGSGLWERGDETGAEDYEIDMRLNVDCFASGSKIEGNNFVIWNRLHEPASYDQLSTTANIPRHHGTYYAKLSANGRYLSQYQYLGDSRKLTGAKLVKFNGKLYAIGYEAVYEAPLANWLCRVENPTSLEMHLNSFGVQVNNRQGMSIQSLVEDATIIIEDTCSIGQLIRASIDGVQVAQGLVDTLTPTIKSSANPAGWSHKGNLVARADKALQDVRAEITEDTLTQNTVFLYPDPPIKGIYKHRGNWVWNRMNWAEKFFPGQYLNLENRAAYELNSSPSADISTNGMTTGMGGKVWDTKPEKVGTWFQDTVWLAMPPMCDGMISAKVRFGDNNNQANFAGATIIRENGLITKINWDAGMGVQPQGACMAGLIVSAASDRQKYAFVWEADSRFRVSTHSQSYRETFDNVDWTGSQGVNKLYLMVSDYNADNERWVMDGEWETQALIVRDAIDLVPGRPAELMVQVIGGTMFCYYRPVPTTGNGQNRWRFAFKFRTGRFGAGRYGLVARGQSNIQWDELWPVRRELNRCDNVTHFWDIKASDGVMDRTIKDLLEKYAWKGLTQTHFTYLIDEPRLLQGIWNGVNALDPVIDFDIRFTRTGESGLAVRATGNTMSPTTSYVSLTIECNGENNQSYFIKRVYLNGVLTNKDYFPLSIPIKVNQTIPVRISVLDSVYSMWIAGTYCGHFNDSIELGRLIGMWEAGKNNSIISDVKLPELYEVVSAVLVDVNQPMDAVIKNIIDKRRIKSVFNRDGSLHFSYYSHFTHDNPKHFEDSLIQNSYKMSDRFISAQEVHGACHYATYENPTLLCMGRRFSSVTIDNILTPEFCYLAAKEIVRGIWETMDMPTFIGLYDLAVHPEDAVTITVKQQDMDKRKFLIDDIQYGFKLDQFADPQFMMTVSCRQWINPTLLP